LDYVKDFRNVYIPKLSASKKSREYCINEYNIAVGFFNEAISTIYGKGQKNNNKSRLFDTCLLMKQAYQHSLQSITSSDEHNVAPLIYQPLDHYFALFGPLLLPIVMVTISRLFQEIKYYRKIKKDRKYS
jgi:hypothetical protein